MDLLPLVMDLGILTVAVVLHEVGHGVVAYRCGDPTAAEQGRLTLNPIRHIDPVGTLLVPGFMLASAWMVGAHPLLFGWAKPVPIDPRRMRRPRRDMALVALAGPMVNFTLAAVAVYGLRLGYGMGDTLAGALVRVTSGLAIGTNVALAVLNLLPILPLDGGRVLTSLLPYRLARLYARVEPFGLLILLVLLYQTNVLSRLVQPVLRTFLALARPS
jgi:Zn-dependent protease